MKSKQILDVQQMQHLQKLGMELKKDTILVWVRCMLGKTPISDWEITYNHSEIMNKVQILPAYTLQDVLDALPEEIEIDNRKYSLIIEKDAVMYVNWIEEAQIDSIWGEGKCINKFVPLIDYAYSMLVECIENGYVETNKNE